MPMPELKQRWRDLVGGEPPGHRREFLVNRLAHRIQELAYGGLSQGVRQKMDDLLDAAGYDENGAVPAPGGTGKKPSAPLVGTRLVRDWNGERYEVTVVASGYEFRGRRYRSLTAIAELITGSHWNGRLFFGVPSGRKHRNGRSGR